MAVIRWRARWYESAYYLVNIWKARFINFSEVHCWLNIVVIPFPFVFFFSALAPLCCLCCVSQSWFDRVVIYSSRFFKKNSAISFIALKPMGKCALVSDSRRVVTVLHCTSNRASFVSIIVSVFVSYFTAYSAPTWFSTGFQHPLRNK